jgi:hypothetical protein
LIDDKSSLKDDDECETMLFNGLIANDNRVLFISNGVSTRRARLIRAIYITVIVSKQQIMESVKKSK